MNKADIEERLDRLAEMHFAENAIKLQFKQMRDSVIPEEVRIALAEIDAEEKTALEAATAGIAALDAEIREGVKALGETAKGEAMMCVFKHGAITWDSKALERYSVEHPEIAKFRKIGNDSTAISWNK